MSADNVEKVNQGVVSKNRIDQVLALLWMALGVLFVVNSWDLEYMAEYGRKI